MIGMVRNPSIAARVAHLVSAYEKPWYVPEGKKPLKELVEKAKAAGGTDDAADMGTAFHGLCEVLDGGNKPAYMPPNLQPWVDCRQAALHDFEPILIEPFVINDELKVGGNPDRYLRHVTTGIVYAADDKTGTDEPEYPLKVTVQVAIAAHALLYNQNTGKRTPIECNQDRGILIHTPIKSGKPRCALYWLDLRKGWELAKLATRVREEARVGKLERIT